MDPSGRACVYTGEVVDSLPDGFGVLTVVEEGPNKGNTTEGRFMHGKMHGEGTWIGASGNKYEGGWVHGCFHGEGTYTWADGSIYVGSFMDDKFHGKGKKTAPDGTVEYDGFWFCDEPAML